MNIAIAASPSGRMGRVLIERFLNLNDNLLKLHAVFCSENSTFLNQDAGTFLGKKTGIIVNTLRENACILSNVECLVDFTNPISSINYLNACVLYGINIVIGTTGFTEQDYKKIKDASKKISVLISPNMSVGMNFVFKMLKFAASILNHSYDVEILDLHHRNKVDAPSGTALRLAEVINLKKENYVFFRHNNLRKTSEVGFSSLRGGDVFGDHSVFFLGNGERIEITHRASSRNIYVDGVIKAINFLNGKKHGLYTMEDII